MDKKIIEQLKGKIKPIEDVPVTAKVLVHAYAGVGKTTFAAIAPKPLIINMEGGLLCLNKFKQYHKELDIQTIDALTIEELKELYWYLKDGDHDRKTVVLDSLSEIRAKSMDEILNDPNRDEKYDRDMPILQDYGKNTQQMRKLVRAYRDLPMNVVFTCLSAEDKDETDGSVKIGPHLTPKLARDVEGYVDVIGYLFATEDEQGFPQRKMLTQPKGKYFAKDRSGKLGLGMEDPTAYHVFNKVTDGAVELPEYIDEIIKEVKKYES